MSRRSKRERVQPQSIFVFILVAVLVALAIVLALRALGGNISTDSATFTRTSVAVVIIRDETIDKRAAFGKVIYRAEEGSVITDGQLVAEVYKFSSSENMMQDLLERQQEIYRYQTGTIWKDVVNAELSDKENAIDAKLTEIVGALQDPRQNDILQLSRDLEGMITDRKAFLQTSTQPDMRLQELYRSEQDYLVSIEGASEEVRASGSGMISFEIDEYSTLLNAETLPQLRASDIQGTWERKSFSQPSVTQEERSLYRLVNPNRFYLAVRTGSRDNYHMMVGNTYQIDFGALYEKTYTATVIHATRGENSVYILQIDDDVTPFLNLRRARISLSGSFSGMSAPAAALRTDYGMEGIVVQLDGENEFVPVSVLCDDGDRIIFNCDDPRVQPGVRVIKSLEGG